MGESHRKIRLYVLKALGSSYAVHAGRHIQLSAGLWQCSLPFDVQAYILGALAKYEKSP